MPADQSGTEVTVFGGKHIAKVKQRGRFDLPLAPAGEVAETTEQ